MLQQQFTVGMCRAAERNCEVTVMPLKDGHVIDLPKITDARGNLTFAEGGNHIPFDIKRVYYLYDVPGCADRA